MKINVSIVGHGRPLVFLHGWGFDHHIWKPVLPFLEEKYQLYLIDLPGFGLTPDMSWEDFKAELKTALPEQFVLIGWSLGGLLATRFAIEETNRVIQLINICALPRFLKDENWPGVEPEVLANFYNNLIRNPTATIQEFVQLQLSGQVVMFENVPPSLAGLKRGLGYLADLDLRDGLSTLSKPVCYMFGRLDAIAYRIYKSMCLTYPQFDYVLFPKAAHIPFLCHTELFIARLEEILL